MEIGVIRRKEIASRLIGVHLEHQTQLLQVILATRTAGRFAGTRQRGQQDRGEDTNDGDYHEQLNERKALFRCSHNFGPYVVRGKNE
jgi:hypothetical protein